MKLLVQDYRFLPDEGKIYFPDLFTKNHPTVTTEDFLLITNITTGDIIYQFNDPALGGDYLHNELTLTYETSGMTATDKLQIFVDVPPAIHIKGEEGRNLGGSHYAPVYITAEDLNHTLTAILKELRKMNLHLESMTDLNLTNRDLDGER